MQRVVGAIGSSLSGLKDIRGIGVCISGGPDSTALMHGIHQWMMTSGNNQTNTVNKNNVVVFHVNHGIRLEAGMEAQWIEGIAKALGLSCVISHLQWRTANEDSKGNKPTHERLRAKRYQSLYEGAIKSNCNVLMTAHHRDDVIETFAQRIHMASGIPGLARGIPQQSQLWPDVTVVRPFIHLDKKALIDAIPEPKQYINDPLNVHPRYLRSRIRAVLEAEPSLASDLGVVHDFVRDVWNEQEALVAKLEAQFVSRVGDGMHVVQAGIVPWISSAAGRHLIRVLVGRIKGTPRLRDASCQHLCNWMISMSEGNDSIGTWSESGCMARWSRKRGHYVIGPLS